MKNVEVTISKKPYCRLQYFKNTDFHAEDRKKSGTVEVSDGAELETL